MTTAAMKQWNEKQAAAKAAMVASLIEAIHEAGAAGLNWRQIESAGWNRDRVSAGITAAVSAGVVHRVWVSRPGLNPEVAYFGQKAHADLHAPPPRYATKRAAPSPLKPASKPKPGKDTREVVGMDTAPRMVCPPCKLDRYAFEPPPGWVGQITRDWRERRLGAMA